MNYYVLIVLLALVIALSALSSVVWGTTLLVSLRSLFLLLAVCSLGILLPPTQETLTRLCFCLGLAGTFMSAVTLAGVACLALKLDLLTFVIDQPNYIYGLPQVVAYFNNPNGLGMFLVFSMAGVAVLFSLYRRQRENSRFVALLFYLALIVQSFTLILTFSRAAFMALSVFVLSFVWLNRRRCSCAPLILLGAAVLVSKQAFEMSNLGEMLDALSTGRIHLWTQGLDLFVHYPVFGTGLGGWLALTGNQLSLHNTYLHLAVELGLAGLIIYLAYTGLFMRELQRMMDRAAMHRSRYTILSGLYALCLGLLVHQLFESYLYRGLPLFLFAMILVRNLVREPGTLYRFRKPLWRQPEIPGYYRKAS